MFDRRMRFLIVRLRKLSGEKMLVVWHGGANYMRNGACANFDLWHSLRFCTLIIENVLLRGINDGQTL